MQGTTNRADKWLCDRLWAQRKRVKACWLLRWAASTIQYSSNRVTHSHRPPARPSAQSTEWNKRKDRTLEWEGVWNLLTCLLRRISAQVENCVNSPTVSYWLDYNSLLCSTFLMFVLYKYDLFLLHLLLRLNYPATRNDLKKKKWSREKLARKVQCLWLLIHGCLTYAQFNQSHNWCKYVILTSLKRLRNGF